MNEDPVFYKKLSKLIKETIDDYHQQRIDEAEFLKRAKEFESTFFNGQKDNIPANLQGNDHGIALFNLINEIFQSAVEDKPAIAAQMAEGLDKVVREIVYENDTLIIDWPNKADVEGQIRIAIDDFLFEFQSANQLELSFDLIDQMVEDGLKVSKLKFV